MLDILGMTQIVSLLSARPRYRAQPLSLLAHLVKLAEHRMESRLTEGWKAASFFQLIFSSCNSTTQGIF